MDATIIAAIITAMAAIIVAVIPAFKKSKTNNKSNEFSQSAAICCKQKNGKIYYLLVKTSGHKWIFPKGNIKKKEYPPETALREAREEAGVLGRVEVTKVGLFKHFKSELKESGKELVIAAYILRVTNLLNEYEEHRNPTWFNKEKAIKALHEGRKHKYGQELEKILIAADNIVQEHC